MPIYEYRCPTCETRTEKLQRYDDPAPKCCDVDMTKLISACAHELKGTGWYKTDFKGK